MYKHPLIDAQKVSSITGLSKPSTYTLISELEKLEILIEMTGAKRGRQYWFPQYIGLFK